MPFGGAWNAAWSWAVSAPGKWFKKRRGWHVEAIAANGVRASGRERWGAPAFFRSPRGMWSFRWFWMSLRSASTTDGWRTGSSSTSGLSRQLLSAMCPWRWTTQPSASPEVQHLQWVGPRERRHLEHCGGKPWESWQASTTWRTSTSRTECIRGGHPPFCFLFYFALRLMDPPCCTLTLLQRGGPRRELIATSLWEPTGWINRHLPGIDPRPMTGKKWGAASSSLFRRQSCTFILSFPLVFQCEVCALWDLVVYEISSLLRLPTSNWSSGDTGSHLESKSWDLSTRRSWRAIWGGNGRNASWRI